MAIFAFPDAVRTVHFVLSESSFNRLK